MKVRTKSVAMSIASRADLIVSSPSCELIRCSLIGSLRRAAGRLPALSTSTRKSTSGCLKLPVIWPNDVIVLLIAGADCTTSSSRIPSLLWRPLAGSGRLRPVSSPNRAAPLELKVKFTHGLSCSSRLGLTRPRSPPVTLKGSVITSTSRPPSAVCRVTNRASSDGSIFLRSICTHRASVSSFCRTDWPAVLAASAIAA